MTVSERDDDFEAYLKRRGHIDRRLKALDRLEPPAELDRIIIAHAREAIHGPAPAPHLHGAGLPAQRWALPMGMAATILLSLSILLDAGMKGAMQKAASSSARRGAPAELVLAMPPQPEPEPESAPAPEPVAQLLPVAAPHLPTNSSPLRSSIGVAASPGLPRAPAAAPLQGTASSNTARVASDSSGSASSSDNARGRISGHFLVTGRVRSGGGSGSPGSGSAEPVQAAVPAAVDGMEIVTVFGTRMVEREIFPLPEFGADPLASLAGAGPATYVPDLSYIISGGNSLDWAAERQRHPNPREWLSHIQKMRVAGLTMVADEELRRFHDAYPAFPVPPATGTDGGTQ